MLGNLREKSRKHENFCKTVFAKAESEGETLGICFKKGHNIRSGNYPFLQLPLQLLVVTKTLEHT